MLYDVQYFWSGTKEDYDHGNYTICNSPELIPAESEEEAIEILKQWIYDESDLDEWDIEITDDRIFAESRFVNVPTQVYWNFIAKEFES